MTSSEIKNRMREIEAEIASIMRIARFLSPEQLSRYEALAGEYALLEASLDESKKGWQVVYLLERQTGEDSVEERVIYKTLALANQAVKGKIAYNVAFSVAKVGEMQSLQAKGTQDWYFLHVLQVQEES